MIKKGGVCGGGKTEKKTDERPPLALSHLTHILRLRPVRHQRVHPVHPRRERPQPHRGRVLDHARVRVLPLQGDVGVAVGVDEQVEGAGAGEEG